MKIVVLAGGLSTERDVSLITGTQVCKALKERGHQAILLDVFLGYKGTEEEVKNIFDEDKDMGEVDQIAVIDPDLEKIKAMRKGEDCFLGPNVVEICRQADMVYMGLHGADGENGKIQATFDILGIRYTGSGYLGSAMAMDKGITKKILPPAGVPMPKGYLVTRQTIRPVPDEIGYPCIVKPCCGGSSVGVSIAHNEKEYKEALHVAFKYEPEILVEEFISGREFSVGIVGGKSMPIIEIIPKEGFYDYKTKYQPGMARDVCPAELTQEQTKKMQTYTLMAYEALKLETYARIDFLVDAKGDMYCLEANTLPGMTPTSLLPQEAKAIGMDYSELCEQIIAEAIYKYAGYPAEVDWKNHLCYTLDDRKSLKEPEMKGMTLEKIAEVCGGTYYGEEEAQKKSVMAITIDSRQITKNCLFVAIKGQRVDGNDFVADSYEKGALCCMSEYSYPEGQSPFENHPYIVVDSCEQALKDMAAYYRSQFDGKVVGITGSVGKTSTKEMIASVLAEKFNVLKTAGNFNNEIGLPLTVFRIRPFHEVAVLEMGISHFGEMTRLSAISKPDVCVITNIGQCHLENLGDRDGILKAKTEVFQNMTADSTVILNGDDDKLITVKDWDGMSPIYYSVNGEAPICAKNVKSLGLRGMSAQIMTPDGAFDVVIPAPGVHMVYNTLAAVSVALTLGMTLDEIKAGIEKYQSIPGRGHLIHTDRYLVMDDCYNANPVSMRAGIDTLSESEGRKVAILGDMYELGTDEKNLHYEVGAYAAKKQIDLVVCIGELSEEMSRGIHDDADSKTEVVYYPTREEAMPFIPGLLKDGDFILVKASHAMEFEKIVSMLEKL